MRLPSLVHTHVKVALLSAALIAVMLGIAGVSVHGVSMMRARFQQGLGRQYEAMDRLLQAERQYLLAQLALDRIISSDQTQQRQAIELSAQHLQKGDLQAQELTKLTAGYPQEQEIIQRYDAAHATWLSAYQEQVRQVQDGKPHPDQTAALSMIRNHFDEMLSALDLLHESVYEPAINESCRQMVQQVNAIGTQIIIALVVGLAVSLFITRAAIRAIRAQHVDLDERTRQREEERQKKEFESRVQRGMDMAQEESHALSTVGHAIREVAPALTTEILLADSSHAHLLPTSEVTPVPPNELVDAPRLTKTV